MREDRVVAMDEGVALRAADLAVSHKPHAIDARIYRAALLNHAELVTCDADFEGLPQVAYFARQR